MATIASLRRHGSEDTEEPPGGRRRLSHLRAFRLRYDRLAGLLSLAGAAIWGMILLRAFSLNVDNLLPVEQAIRTLAETAVIGPILLGLAAVDLLIGVALIKGVKYGRTAARLRAIVGFALCAAYYAHFQEDFTSALLFAIVQGLILALLSRNAGVILIYPSMIWLGVFFLVPLVSVLASSLGKGTTLGTVDLSVPSLENYQRIIQPVGQSGLVYISVILRTLWIAFLNTALCLIIGYPFAFWMARQPQNVRNTLMLLVMIPFWTNILLRTYAWLIILRKDGLFNGLLVNVLGIIDKPLELLNTPGALLLGLVYGYLPYMILPLYTSIERLDKRYIEAANDLYASPAQAFLRVILPLTAPGIIAGSILVFIPSVGTYVVTNLLGGGKIFLIGNLLEQQFVGSSGNKAFGAAFGVVLTIFMLIATLIYFRLGRKEHSYA